MDHTIPKQFILEINSEENFTQGAGALSFVFNLLQPKASFPTSTRVSAALGSEQLRAEPLTRAAPRGAPLLARPRLCHSRVPYHQFCSSQALGARPLGPHAPPGLSSISPLLEPPPGPILPAVSPCACRIRTQSFLAVLGRDCDLQAFTPPIARPVAA